MAGDSGFIRNSAAKLVGGAVALAVIVAAVSWFEMSPAERAVLLHSAGWTIGWLVAVAVLPWLTTPITLRIARLQSNLAAGVWIGALTLIEAGALLKVFANPARMPAVWAAATVGGLLAAAYNVLACDWIAEKYE